MYDVDETIVAISSALGGAERGIVRLSGPRVVPLLEPLFLPDQGRLTSVKRATCLPGSWQLPHPRAQLRTQLYLWPTQRSYTRQPTGELHTVGSPPLLERIVAQLCDRGARLAQPGEFTLRAFLAGRLDLPQVEAVLGVIEAHDQRQLQVALNQLAGGLSQTLSPLRERLLNLYADVEAELDFVDEGIEFISSAEIEETLTEIAIALDGLLGRLAERARADQLPRVLLLGRPNVGKSTLWNALLRRDAAIVSEFPGTTRDYLEATLQLDGQRFQLIDSAGIDTALSSDIDRASQTLAQRIRDQADLLVLCLDATRPLQDWEEAQLRTLPADAMLVLNKAEEGVTRFTASLPADWRVDERERWLGLSIGAPEPGDQSHIRHRQLIKLSALRGWGLDEVERRLSQRLQQTSADESSLVATTATRCRSSLRRTVESIQRAQAIVAQAAGQELLAAEVRAALDDLGQILGAVYTDDILDRIFSRFCIGK